MKKTLFLSIAFLLLVLGACANNDNPEPTIDEEPDETVETTELDWDMMGDWFDEHKDFLNNQPTLGDKDAPITMLVFADYKCPYCAQWDAEVLPDLEKGLVETGEVQIKFINFPFLGPDSITAAYAGESIYHQNEEAFWEYSQLVYENRNEEEEQWATKEFILDLVQDVDGIDLELLEEDIDEETYKDNVEEDRLFAMQSQINATPSIIMNGYTFENAFDTNIIFGFVHDFYEGYEENEAS